MDSFQWIVIGVALFFLIIILIAVGMLMTNTNSTTVFPPVQQPCPDLWTSDGDGNCFYVGQNYGSAFSKSNGQLMYNGSSEYPIYTYSNNKWYNSNGKPITQPNIINSLPNNLPNHFAVFSTKDSKWTKKGNALCSNKSFSNDNNIYWDGVSNTNQC